MKVKISAAGARHLFACSLEYITGTCKGRCCVGGAKLLVSLLPEEAAWQEAQGFPTKDGLIMPAKNGLCPHKKPDGLCRIHGTGHKPFGCIASPFTLNHSDTLIVRHRYYNLKCHGSGTPAFVAFRASLDLIFGEKEAGRICDHLAKSDQDITAEMPAASYKALHGLDTIKKAKKSGSPPAPPARKEKEKPVTKIEHNIAAGLLPLAVDINSLSEDPRNARVHPEENLKAIMRSLTYYGQRKPIVVNEADHVIEAGNGLFLAARELGWTKIAAVMVKDDPATAEGFAIMDNQSALLSEWNLPLLKDLLIELDTGSFDMDLTGFNSQAIEDLMTSDGVGGSGSGGMTKDQARVTLAERFIVPPFTVLDTRQGYWRERAQAWFEPSMIRRIWPDLFDATSGHLPASLMVKIAEAMRADLGPLKGREYMVPTGSGETIVCLGIAFPGIRFRPVYNLDRGTIYEPQAPLNDLVFAWFGPPIERGEYERTKTD